MMVRATLLAFGLTSLISMLLIRFAPLLQIAIKPELESTQRVKQGTPSVGGIAFVLGTTASTSLFFSSPEVALPLLAMLLFAGVGLIDDLSKVRKGSSDGISSAVKILLQAAVALFVLLLLARSNLLSPRVRLPTLNRTTLNLGRLYYLFALIYILYFVNAVNITDGLDALAAGASLPLLCLLAFVALQRGVLFSPALIGSIGAFLFFNKRPARYFMGDCGSHALGGYIAVSALMLHAEVLVLVASGLFLMELASSLIQIIAIRSTGKKVFSIAPLHHAFELKGVDEQTIVGRFTLLSWFFASLGLLLYFGTGW